MVHSVPLNELLLIRFPPVQAYQGNYTKPRLRDWAKKIEAWHSDLKSIYFYFDNDQAGYAAKNAGELKRLVFG